MRCTKKIVLSAAFLLFSTLCVIPLFARDVSIQVKDMDLGLPLEGAVIRSWDGRQYSCDEDGKALIQVPDERQVVIQISYPGYEISRLVVAVGADQYSLGLRLSGIMESRELVIEAARPGISESQTGRSVAVSEREIAQTGQIGIIEDVMTTIKLLPGVGYAGFFDAQPSIRGGDPRDMKAALDGFYLFHAYHWGGGFSIFDPRIVQSAQLSHGVYTSRYGHSISGLLEITTKDASPTQTEFEFNVGTSAANGNLSIPLFGKGGILFMGRVTYYDPFVWLAQKVVSNIDGMEEQATTMNGLKVPPYIRSGTITGNYRFFDNLELRATGFIGVDGIGYLFSETDIDTYGHESTEKFDWTNLQAFFTTGLYWNPRNDMLLKLSAGLGCMLAESRFDVDQRVIGKTFSPTSANSWYYEEMKDKFLSPYNFSDTMSGGETDTLYNAQGRIDYDWELGNGFIAAAGVQEMFTFFGYKGDQQLYVEKLLADLSPDEQAVIKGAMNLNDTVLEDMVMISFPAAAEFEANNKIFTTSGYGLVEYKTPNERFGGELGLRVDHYYITGRNFSLPSKPVLNPRLSMDFNVFKNGGFLQSLNLTAGTGLFSSMTDYVAIIDSTYQIDEFKPNRSWTSVLGAKLDFAGGIVFNIEGYCKYMFDRMYIPVSMDVGNMSLEPYFNGEGRVWGIDVMLQKKQSRFWDGWLSYSFNWTEYRDPDAGSADFGFAGGEDGNDWYFPWFHRFHNLNLVLNIKPQPRFNIYTRLGIASGALIEKLTGGDPASYPVYKYDPAGGQFIEKYYWLAVSGEKKRTTPALELDIKFSIYGKNNNAGKTRSEVYVAVENVLGLLYTSVGNTSFNEYTGEVATDNMASSYGMPIPMPSFGFKYSY